MGIKKILSAWSSLVSVLIDHQRRLPDCSLLAFLGKRILDLGSPREFYGGVLGILITQETKQYRWSIRITNMHGLLLQSLCHPLQAASRRRPSLILLEHPFISHLHQLQELLVYNILHRVLPTRDIERRWLARGQIAGFGSQAVTRLKNALWPRLWR